MPDPVATQNISTHYMTQKRLERLLEELFPEYDPDSFCIRVWHLDFVAASIRVRSLMRLVQAAGDAQWCFTAPRKVEEVGGVCCKLI